MLNNVVYSYFDEEEYKSIIRSTIKQFRQSAEYKLWLNMYDRDTCGATGLNTFTDGIDIELHHYNTTLWSWVEEILNIFQMYELPFNTFLICNILIDIHLNRCIPCIPLSKDTHKQIHNNEEETIKKYPNILRNLHEGNMHKANEIIHYHVDIIKDILNKEKRL